jgi:hypothetical protein
MVARIQHHTAGLAVTFERDGEEQDRQVAPTGRDAVKAALMMLVRLDHLQDGDRLTVTEVAKPLLTIATMTALAVLPIAVVFPHLVANGLRCNMRSILHRAVRSYGRADSWRFEATGSL